MNRPEATIESQKAEIGQSLREEIQKRRRTLRNNWDEVNQRLRLEVSMLMIEVRDIHIIGKPSNGTTISHSPQAVGDPELFPT